MIKIANLNKVFINNNGEKTKALNDINLNINKSEIFGIIGLSGAGKSTLIRTINRLEEPTSGSIIIEGLDITTLSKSDLKETRKEIGMIFQHFNLLSSRNVYENIAFPMEIAKKSKSEIDTRVKELINLVGLNSKESSYPSQLSGGQKQRVAIARALANNPKVLLSDEATSALDPNTTKSILNLLKNINSKLGITVVMITHQMEVIREVCNRVAIIEDGEIVELDKVEEVFSNPKTKIAKDFVSNIQHENTELVYPKESGYPVIKISYLGNSAKKPIISNLIKKFDIDINIISGDISQLMSTCVGNLTIQLIGVKENIDSSIKYLENENLSVEVIWSE